MEKDEEIQTEKIDIPLSAYSIFLIALSFLSVGLLFGVTMPNKENILVTGALLGMISMVLAIYGFFKYEVLEGK